MTMVAGFKFAEGTVIIADSRVTFFTHKNKTLSDTAQKIIYLTPKLALSFAGNIRIAEEVICNIRKNITKKPNLKIPQKLARDMSRIATYSYNKHKSGQKKFNSVSIILGGVDFKGETHLYSCSSPNFKCVEIEKGFSVIGSGEVVRGYLDDDYARIKKEGDLKTKADMLCIGLDSELSKYDIDTVGGLLQVILIDSKGIRPLQRWSADLTPEKPRGSQGIEMIKGQWIQKDFATGDRIKLVEPRNILRSYPKELQFYNYTLPNSQTRKANWYIIYFLLCVRVQRDLDGIKFEGLIAQVTSLRYPRKVPVVASLCFWGGVGEYDLKIVFSSDNEEQTIYNERIKIQYCPEQVEIDIPLELDIKTSGVAFIDCLIAEKIIARKSIYFFQGDESILESSEKRTRALQQSMDDHILCSDSKLKTMNCFVEYFVLCTEADNENQSYSFKGEMRAVYWKDYPLKLKVFIATAIRLSEGTHDLTIEVVNAHTTDSFEIASCKSIIPTSECLAVPVWGDLIVQIPSPGIYFFNLKIDGQFATSSVLNMETDKPQFSYSLLEEDLAKVRSGELLMSTKRSRQKDEKK